MELEIAASFGSLYCHACGEILGGSKCADPFARCLACVNHHRFYILPQSPTMASSATAATLTIPGHLNYDARTMAEFWLSDAHSRSVLNPQLAEILRMILENTKVEEELPVAFCPTCGKKLSQYEQSDAWVIGYRCSSNHRWASRGSRLHSEENRLLCTIEHDPPYSTLTFLVDSWLGDNPALKTQLHKSVRHVLETFKQAWTS